MGVMLKVVSGKRDDGTSMVMIVRMISGLLTEGTMQEEKGTSVSFWKGPVMMNWVSEEKHMAAAGNDHQSRGRRGESEGGAQLQGSTASRKGW